MNGIGLIDSERTRQIEAEGYSAEHDDEQHAHGDMALAAACYLMQDENVVVKDLRGTPPCPTLAGWIRWPWHRQFYKRTPDDRIRELVKAGALIVAEIDRLKRADATG